MNNFSVLNNLLKKVLFVAYGGGHVAALAPIAKKMLAMKFDVNFLALTTAMEFLEVRGIPYIKYSDLPGAMDDDVVSYGKYLMSQGASNIKISTKETIAYLGLNFREMVRLHGEELAHIKYKEYGRQSFLPINLFVEWFRISRPDVVVATNSPRSEQAAILAAGILGIPSLCVLDLFGMQEVEWLGQPNYADRVCVLNQQVKDMLVDHGRSPQEIAVTGNPAFESINSPKLKDLAIQKRLSMGWGATDFVILFASQVEPVAHPFSSMVGDPLLPRKIENKLRDFVSVDDHAHLVVRFHPSEDVVFKEGQARVTSSNQLDNLEILLHAVDIVVVVTSTVGVQAYLAGKEVVAIQSSVLASYTPFKKMGMAKGVDDLDQLINEVKLSCDRKHSSTRSASATMGYKFNDISTRFNSTESIIEQITDLLNNKS